jgi:dTDP-4-dehydrorhamnose reductase
VRVLITGAGGQLGLDLLDAFAADDVVGLTRDELDVSDEDAVRATVTDVRPELVINAASWTDVDGCEADPARAHDVHALGPWWLARGCKEVGAALLTVSSDYVFDGHPPSGGDDGYREFAVTAPGNEYGRSKVAGETLVRRELDAHYIVRTAWVSGARGGNFVRTMLRIAREHGEADVVDDQVGSPTFTRDLAAALHEIAPSGKFGTYHRTNRGTCTWFDLAHATFALAGLDVDLRRMGSEQLQRPARRPAFSVLSNLHAERVGFRVMPHWRDGLRDLLDELGELAHR